MLGRIVLYTILCSPSSANFILLCTALEAAFLSLLNVRYIS